MTHQQSMQPTSSAPCSLPSQIMTSKSWTKIRKNINNPQKGLGQGAKIESIIRHIDPFSHHLWSQNQLIKLWNEPTSTTRLNQPGGVGRWKCRTKPLYPVAKNAFHPPLESKPIYPTTQTIKRTPTSGKRIRTLSSLGGILSPKWHVKMKLLKSEWGRIPDSAPIATCNR